MSRNCPRFVWVAVAAVVGWPALAARAEDFTIVMLPDTQYYSALYPTIFAEQTRWIVNNLTDQNIAFVSHVGDIVENGAVGLDGNLAEWQRADQAMGTLDGSPGLPYSIVIGNHDYDSVNRNDYTATRYSDFFGPDRFEDRAWYGGASANRLNQYQLFRGGGRTFLHIGLEWEPSDAAIDWAQSILDEHADLPTIISTHSYLTSISSRLTFAQSPAGNSAEEVFQRLVYPNPQVFMVLNGHFPGEGRTASYNIVGQPVFEMLADYQYRANGGDGWLRLIHFRESESQIAVETFSPTRNFGLGEYETDFDSQFSFPLDFDDRLGPIHVPEPSTIVMALLAAVMVWRCRAKRSDRSMTFLT